MVALAWRMASTGIAVLKDGTVKRKTRSSARSRLPACSEHITLRILYFFLSDYTFLCNILSQAHLVVEEAFTLLLPGSCFPDMASRDSVESLFWAVHLVNIIAGITK